MYTISSYKEASKANIDMGDVGEPPAGARISILVSQNARKFKDKDNLGGVPKIKKNQVV